MVFPDHPPSPSTRGDEQLWASRQEKDAAVEEMEESNVLANHLVRAGNARMTQVTSPPKPACQYRTLGP